jgi:hypothetical protein
VAANPFIEAELVWLAEVARRQERHEAEVWRRLAGAPRGGQIRIDYGPGLSATGVIEELDEGGVTLRLGPSWTRWIPLLQI